MALTPGTRLGYYEILGAIGAGGMGEVYRARDPRLDREVAIKVLPAAARDAIADALARFEREAMSVAKLSHPNILSIFEFARDGRHRLRRHGAGGRRDAARAARTAAPCRRGGPSRTRCRSPEAWPPRTRAASSIAISSPRT